VDHNGTPFSGVVDATCTSVLDRTLVKVLAWYDNEMGYSARVADLTALLARYL
jgi:glyceraldehyde 3-phosphate dehydrogenase